MKLQDEKFKIKLKESAKEKNISLDEKQIEMFLKYKNNLIEWNNKINLTTIIDDEEIIQKHFIDCLMITKHTKEKDVIIDVGSGAGLPGLVIAIYFKGKAKITLLEPMTKRVIFLEDTVKKLNIQNITIINDRAEKITREEFHREKYDIVIARAVSKLNILMECTIPFIKQHAKALFMKGPDLENELNDAREAFKELACMQTNIYEYELILGDETYKRNIIEITKEEKTKEIYPREYSQIKKNPL